MKTIQIVCKICSLKTTHIVDGDRVNCKLCAVKGHDFKLSVGEATSDVLLTNRIARINDRIQNSRNS